jgi:hypothetical protein
MAKPKSTDERAQRKPGPWRGEIDRTRDGRFRVRVATQNKPKTVGIFSDRIEATIALEVAMRQARANEGKDVGPPIDEVALRKRIKQNARHERYERWLLARVDKIGRRDPTLTTKARMAFRVATLGIRALRDCDPSDFELVLAAHRAVNDRLRELPKGLGPDRRVSVDLADIVRAIGGSPSGEACRTAHAWIRGAFARANYDDEHVPTIETLRDLFARYVDAEPRRGQLSVVGIVARIVAPAWKVSETVATNRVDQHVRAARATLSKI